MIYIKIVIGILIGIVVGSIFGNNQWGLIYAVITSLTLISIACIIIEFLNKKR